VAEAMSVRLLRVLEQFAHGGASPWPLLMRDNHDFHASKSYPFLA
jgi:hypothetical protein